MQISMIAMISVVSVSASFDNIDILNNKPSRVLLNEAGIISIKVTSLILIVSMFVAANTFSLVSYFKNKKEKLFDLSSLMSIISVFVI